MPPTHLLQSPVDRLRCQEMREGLWSLTEAATSTSNTVQLINILLLLELQGHCKNYFLKVKVAYYFSAGLRGLLMLRTLRVSRSRETFSS